MNRRQQAMERRHLPQSDYKGRKNRVKAEYIQKNRELCKQDITTKFIEMKEDAAKGMWRMWRMTPLTTFLWQTQLLNLIDDAHETASNNWDESLGVQWLDFLEQHCYAEFDANYSPLAKAMR